MTLSCLADDPEAGSILDQCSESPLQVDRDVWMTAPCKRQTSILVDRACLCYFSAFLLQPCWKRNLIIMRWARVPWVLFRCPRAERHCDVGVGGTRYEHGADCHCADLVLQKCDICFGFLGSGISHFRFFGWVLGRFPEIVYPGNVKHWLRGPVRGAPLRLSGVCQIAT